MGSLGWHNPLPFEVGGGPTEGESIYLAMRAAVGTGGSAKDDSGIEGLWRQSKAMALASVSTFAERAILQAFPQVATDHLPLFENYFGITPTSAETDEQRRAAVVAAFTQNFFTDGPNLRAAIQHIDPRADIVDIDHTTSSTVMLGKAFEPQDGSPSYGVNKFTGWPNWSTEFWVTVHLDLGTSPFPTGPDTLVIQRLRRYLREALGAWVDFQVVTSIGFFADLSPVDLTAMT